MRTMQEGDRVMDTFKNHLHLPVTKIDDSKRMLARLKVPHPSPQQQPALPPAWRAAMQLALPSRHTLPTMIQCRLWMLRRPCFWGP